MRAKLTCNPTVFPAGEILIEKFPVSLGRGSNADVQIDDRWASRRHCEIDERDGVLIVRDLQSTHGTYINGRAVSEAPLLPSDILTVGLSRFSPDYASDTSAAEQVELAPIAS